MATRFAGVRSSLGVPSMPVFLRRPRTVRMLFGGGWTSHGLRAFLLVALVLVVFLLQAHPSPKPLLTKVETLSHNQSPVSGSPSKVNVGVYYEALCGDSRRFMTQQIRETREKVGDIMEIQLFPYGKATERQAANGTWLFTCHFGPNECKANIIQTCAINLYWEEKQNEVLDLINCMELQSLPHTAAEKCAMDLGLDYKPIHECKDSPQGNAWQHEVALKTQALNPPLNFVPWITIDGVHDPSLHSEYLDNLTYLVCQAYKGEKPPACSSA